MKYSINYTKKFKKNLRLCKKRGYDMNLFEQVSNLLETTGSLPPNTTRISYPGNTQDCGNAISKETGC